MSLGPVVIREPGDEIPASDAVIYRAFINALDRPSRTSPERAMLRAAHRTGVSRRRVWEVVRTLNEEALND